MFAFASSSPASLAVHGCPLGCRRCGVVVHVTESMTTLIQLAYPITDLGQSAWTELLDLHQGQDFCFGIVPVADLNNAQT